VAENDKRRREDRPRLVLYDEDVTLEFPQQVGDGVGPDEYCTTLHTANIHDDGGFHVAAEN